MFLIILVSPYHFILSYIYLYFSSSLQVYMQNFPVLDFIHCHEAFSSFLCEMEQTQYLCCNVLHNQW